MEDKMGEIIQIATPFIRGDSEFDQSILESPAEKIIFAPGTAGGETGSTMQTITTWTDSTKTANGTGFLGSGLVSCMILY